MATQARYHKVEEPIPADVPDEREYEQPQDAELDHAIVNAINAAEKADNDYLVRLLALELGAHYETR